MQTECGNCNQIFHMLMKLIVVCKRHVAADASTALFMYLSATNFHHKASCAFKREGKVYCILPVCVILSTKINFIEENFSLTAFATVQQVFVLLFNYISVLGGFKKMLAGYKFRK